MLVRIAQMFDEGRPLPRNRAVTRQPDIEGRLCVTEQYDKDFRRTIRTARVEKLDGTGPAIPDLRDAVVIWIGDGHMTIAGFEQDAMSRRCSSMSWYVAVVGASRADVGT